MPIDVKALWPMCLVFFLLLFVFVPRKTTVQYFANCHNTWERYIYDDSEEENLLLECRHMENEKLS